MVSASIEKKLKIVVQRKRRQLRGNKAQAEELKNSPRLHVCSLPLQLCCVCVCVFTARVCITCVGLLYVLFSPCVCVCVYKLVL